MEILTITANNIESNYSLILTRPIEAEQILPIGLKTYSASLKRRLFVLYLIFPREVNSLIAHNSLLWKAPLLKQKFCAYTVLYSI